MLARRGVVQSKGEEEKGMGEGDAVGMKGEGKSKEGSEYRSWRDSRRVGFLFNHRT